MSKTPICPFIKKECMEHKCMLYTHITMKDPQSGMDKDEWTCSLVLIPIMMLENARQTRGVQSATESMRNEIVKRMDNHALPAPASTGYITMSGSCESNDEGVSDAG